MRHVLFTKPIEAARKSMFTYVTGESCMWVYARLQTLATEVEGARAGYCSYRQEHVTRIPIHLKG